MKTRRILSVVLAIMFVLSTFTFASVSVSAAAPEIYLDQANGSDSNDGASAGKAVKTLEAAFKKVDDGGTIYLVGDYAVVGNASLPSTDKFITLSGSTGNEKLVSDRSCAVFMQSDMRFEKITLVTGQYGHLNTDGHLIVLGEGAIVGSTSNLHLGKPGTTSKGEHVIIDGANFTRPIQIGAYINSLDTPLVKGDVTYEVISGTLDTLNIVQDGYDTTGASGVPVTGNINVRIGAAGTVKKMNNSGRYAHVLGYFQLILEEGGSMCALDLTNFDHKDYYKIVLDDTTHGNVDFTSTAGEFEISANDGYIAKIEYDGYVTYAPAGVFKAPLGEEVHITFTNEKKIAPSNVDVTVTPATPETSEWPISVSDNEHFEATILSHTPDDSEVGYAIPYTYEIAVTTKDPYVMPLDFTFTINGSSEYRIENYTESYDSVSFTYTAEMTAKDETRAMISYVGGIGTAGKAPFNKFADFNSIIVVDEQYFTQGGYSFDGYSDGTNIYQPGDSYQVGNDDVVFTAVWTQLDKIQVVFDGGAATGGVAPTTLEDYEGKYVTIPECTFANTGFVFTHWEDEAGNKYNPGDLVLLSSSNLYLTAKWEVNPIAGDFIYVNSVAGSDSNDGLTPDTAVSTITQAVALANGGDVTVIVIGALTLDGTLPENAGNVTITGYDDDASLIINKSVALGSATNIENINIDAAKGAYIATNGNKAVIGPNLANLGEAYDIVDGGIDTTVDGVDTVLKDGITVGTYYLGGVDLSDSTKGINGDVTVTVDGANIGLVDFAPKGGNSGAVAATINGYIVFNVNGGIIGEFVSTKQYVRDTTNPVYIFFNNSTIPTLDKNDFEINLLAGKPNAYVIDSGIGGAVEFQGDTPHKNGRIKATADTTKDVWVKSSATGKYSNKTGSTYIAVSKANRYYSKIRYGEAFTGDIEATIVEPTGGAEATSIVATPVDPSITDIVTIQLDGWSPKLINDKFSYETQYSASILVSLAEGYFFDDLNLPAVILNGVDVASTVNADATLSASYQFETKTGYAPTLTATFETGDSAVEGNPPEPLTWEHMSTNKLPDKGAMANLGYRFVGWRCDADGVLYKAGQDYSMTSNTDVVFTAEWSKRGSWELPNVVILYDLSAYGRDKGRNPGFEKDDEPILVSKAFATLEHEISGTKNTKSTQFDHETAVVIASDGAGKAFTINDYTLNRTKADTHQYPHLTIIYYYETEKGAAAGDYGHINYGNVILADGSKSSWFGKPVLSKEPVVANKWACVTWDFTEFNELYSVPEGSIYNQFHISPIGTKTLSELKGDTLYLKAMYFSKYPAITK